MAEQLESTTVSYDTLRMESMERQRSEAALAASRQMLTSILDTLPLGVFWKDCNGVYQGCNVVFAADAGFTHPEDVVGMTDQEMPWRDLAPLYREDDHAVIVSGQAKLNYEEPFKTVAGNDLQRAQWVRTSKIPLRDVGSNIIGVLGTYEEITDRKQAEEEQRATSRLLHSIVENIPNMIFMKRATDLRFVLFNKAGEQLLGFKRTDLLEKNDYDFFPKEQAAFFIAKDRDVLHSSVMLDIPEEFINNAHGEQRILHTKKLPLFNDQGEPEYLLGISEDITELKKTELRLRESLTALEKLAWLLQPRTFSAGAFAPVYGDVTALNKNRTILDALGAQTLHAIISEFMGMLETSCAVYEINGDYAAGIFSSGWCQLMDGASYQLCGVEDAATALNCGKWLCHESCWKEAAKPAIDMDGPNDIECAGGIRLFAVPIRMGDTIIGGINFGYGSPPKDQEKLAELAEKYHVTVNELVVAANAYPERPKFVIELAKRRLVEAANMIGLLVSRRKNEAELKQAITETQRYAEELRIANHELEHSNLALRDAKARADEASATKSQFLANMSHEIRTPMNAVMGLLQLLEHTQLDARQRDYLDKSKTAAQSLLMILNDILDFSKVEAGRLELEQAPFSLHRLLGDLSVILSSAVHEKDVEVLFDIDGRIPNVVGDSLRLQQVLLNLAGNAIKFTERGEVILTVKVRELTPIRTQIEFAVRDTGIGISPEKLAMIFDGFCQAEASTTRRFGGTGLGLAISQRLVELMGGQLSVESTHSVGSRFSFTLPFTLPREQDLNDATASAASLQTVRVLVVDDNEIAREVLVRMTNNFGWQAEAATNGAEAIVLLEQRPGDSEPFDVVLLDWKMPNLDGWETAQRIRSLRFSPHYPLIIMVTAYGREVLQQHHDPDDNPLDGFLTKPVTPSALFDTVAQVLTGKTIETEPLPTPFRDTLPLSGLRVLLVEDNPTNQQVARELLTLLGAHVEVANNGREGVQAVQTASLPFAAVLMDIQMPVMDGYEATRILRQQYAFRDLPIIAMTANALPTDRQICLAAGMNDHVSKPFNIRKLLDVLIQHCGLAPDQPIPVNPEIHFLPKVSALASFDLDAALARLNHNLEIYLSIAKHFRRDQQIIFERLRADLLQGKHAEAGRELHTLRGIAGAVGAVALCEWLAYAETSLKSEEDTDPARLLEPLETKLTETLTDLDRIVAQLSAPPTVPNAVPPAFDPRAVMALLDTLEPLLRASNLHALAVYATLKEEYGPVLGSALDPLEAAMCQMNFTAAQVASQALKTAIGA